MSFNALVIMMWLKMTLMEAIGENFRGFTQDATDDGLDFVVL